MILWVLEAPRSGERTQSPEWLQRALRFSEARWFLRLLVLSLLVLWALVHPSLRWTWQLSRGLAAESGGGWMSGPAPSLPSGWVLYGLGCFLAAWLLLLGEWTLRTLYFPRRSGQIDLWHGPLALLALALLPGPGLLFQGAFLAGQLSLPPYLLLGAALAAGSLATAWRLRRGAPGLVRLLLLTQMLSSGVQAVRCDVTQGAVAVLHTLVVLACLLELREFSRTRTSLRRLRRLPRLEAVGILIWLGLLFGGLVQVANRVLT